MSNTIVLELKFKCEMTNEEIIETWITQKGGTFAKLRWSLNSENIKEMLSIARTDERNKVIEEIEKLCQPSTPICESNLGMESFKKIILDKLSQLKEQK